MFKTNAPDSVANAYVDIDEGAGTPGTRLTADDRNITQDELVAMVISSSQALDPTGVDRNQLARAANTIGSTMFLIDSGVADAYEVAYIAPGIVHPASSDDMSGFVIMFTPSAPNATTTPTVDFEGLGPKTVSGGALALRGGELSGTVILRFNPGADKWITVVDASSGYNSGDIHLWSGAIADIPAYKHICDGTNGTPNLTDRFVIHADADAAGTHNVGDTIDGVGTAEDHTLLLPEIPSHTHSTTVVAAGTGLASGANFTGAAATTTGAAGGGDPHAHAIDDYKPKSFALAYVMVL